MLQDVLEHGPCPLMFSVLWFNLNYPDPFGRNASVQQF